MKISLVFNSMEKCYVNFFEKLRKRFDTLNISKLSRRFKEQQVVPQYWHMSKKNIEHDFIIKKC
jgi:hypothetical protein